MIRIVIEAETVEEALKEARLIGKAPDPSYITIKDQTFPLVPAGDVLTMTKEEAVEILETPPSELPPVEAAPFTIPAIDALPKIPPAAFTEAPPPPPPAVTSVHDVDARGIPWDGRVHASNRAQTKDGNWKRRKGVSLEEMQRTEAELVAGPTLDDAYTNGSAVLDLPAAPPPPPTTSTVSNPSSTAHTMQAPPPPPAPATFDQLMREAGRRNLGITNLNALTAEVTGGKITQIALIADKAAWIQGVYDRIVAS